MQPACLVAGYSVDMREDDVNHWSNLTSFASGFTYVAKELNKGTHYRFRIRAENKFGSGEPAETDVIIAKDPYGTQNDKTDIYQRRLCRSAWVECLGPSVCLYIGSITPK